MSGIEIAAFFAAVVVVVSYVGEKAVIIVREMVS